MARRLMTVGLLLPAFLGCASAAHQETTPAAAPAHEHGTGARIHIPAGALYTVADVSFLQGMIAHHAQAVHMSHLAETRAADPRLLRLAQKIGQSQIAEIDLMQGWLADHDQFVPDTSSHRNMMMPGMLTPAQLAELEAASGPVFDRRFLELMILHHEGALAMVADLLASPGAAQDVDVNVLANEVHLVQTAELGAMHQMLDNLEGESP
ncbi:MAG TPA: DUF305 domain-containing protein [Gemmatimonadales bacterium]|nr:DUF305 domain-containing protein [Gemmatimonadales bacterium]